MKGMNSALLEYLLVYIDREHSFKKGKGKRIKYVVPTIDTRTMRIHAIIFYGMVEDKAFSLTNENKDKDLHEWIMEWLTEDM